MRFIAYYQLIPSLRMNKAEKTINVKRRAEKERNNDNSLRESGSVIAMYIFSRAFLCIKLLKAHSTLNHANMFLFCI